MVVVAGLFVWMIREDLSDKDTFEKIWKKEGADL